MRRVEGPSPDSEGLTNPRAEPPGALPRTRRRSAGPEPNNSRADRTGHVTPERSATLSRTGKHGRGQHSAARTSHISLLDLQHLKKHVPEQSKMSRVSLFYSLPVT